MIKEIKRIKRIVHKLLLFFTKITHSKSYMQIYNKYLRACGVDVEGNVKFINSSVYLDTAYGTKIHIGDNCVMSVNTIVLAHDFSLECGMASLGLGDLKNEKKIVRDVYIGNNVFIGAGCTILPGTHIGDNCIIGAGTVCSGRIPDNSIVVGGKWKVIADTREWTEEKIRQYADIQM